MPNIPSSLEQMHVTLHVDPFQSLALNVVPTKLVYVIVSLLIQWFKNTTLNEYILFRLFLWELPNMLTGLLFIFQRRTDTSLSCFGTLIYFRQLIMLKTMVSFVPYTNSFVRLELQASYKNLYDLFACT